MSPRFSVKQYKKQVEGQINDPCLAQFWVKRQAVVPSGPDAEERDSSVMGDWTEDEGTEDVRSAVVEPEYEMVERPEEVQTRVSETLEAMMLLGPAFSGDASVSAEHSYATCSARACFCVANKFMQTKQKTLVVVWTMDDFELTGYPPPEDQLVIPMVLSTFPPLLKLVWQNRVLNLGMDDSVSYTHLTLPTKRIV